MIKKFIPIIVLALAVTAVVFLFVNNQEGKASMVPGEQALDFSLQDVNGKTYQLSDFKGQTIVLNFFATWCQPCIDEAPDLEAFGADYKDAQLIIIARGEPQKRIEKYIEETNSKLLYLLDTKESVSKDYNVIGQPETLIINKEGTIVERFSGPTTKETLISLIEEKA